MQIHHTRGERFSFGQLEGSLVFSLRKERKPMAQKQGELADDQLVIGL